MMHLLKWIKIKNQINNFQVQIESKEFVKKDFNFQ